MEHVGDFELLERIGAGGMGEVWLAENRHTKVKYAVKILPAGASKDTGFVDRFFDEGRLMAQLDHPYIVRVHHVGHDENQNRYYLVMDYVQDATDKAVSLQDCLKAQPEGRLEESCVRKWAVQLCEALAYAHDKGIAHRDIKPANIMVDSDGNIRLTDFGLAKVLGGEFLMSQIHQSMRESMAGGIRRASPEISVGEQKTMGADSDGSPRQGSGQAGGRSSSESLIGTYDYMSPEARGELPGDEVGFASDIYSFGVMLYRMLTGRRPSGMAEPPSRLVNGLSKKWDSIVSQCMRHDPADRYSSAEELLCVIRKSSGNAWSRWRWLAAIAAVIAVSFGFWQLFFETLDDSANSTSLTNLGQASSEHSSAQQGDRTAQAEHSSEDIESKQRPEAGSRDRAKQLEDLKKRTLRDTISHTISENQYDMALKQLDSYRKEHGTDNFYSEHVKLARGALATEKELAWRKAEDDRKKKREDERRQTIIREEQARRQKVNTMLARRPKVRQEMISLIKAQGIKDEAIFGAMNRIPMEAFCPAAQMERVYTNGPIPIGFSESISQPYITALMISELKSEPGAKVLELKTASGYQTALLYEMGADVYSVESDPALAAVVEKSFALVGMKHVNFLKGGDIHRGWPERGPFDRIIATAAYAKVPWPILNQMADGGRFVTPLGVGDKQMLVVLHKKGKKVMKTELCRVRFSMMPGEQQ